MFVSVITCTFNPRRDHLERTLEALRQQTLPGKQWEFLLVDNGSKPAISPSLDGLPSARILPVEQPGKIHALLAAIEEAQGELLIIVDDDNVLAPDFLELAVDVAVEKPFLGAWGGQIIPEFEVPPPEWSKPYLNLLTLKTLDREEWSNLPTGPAPAGAGMCLRSSVARRFVENLAAHPERRMLGRAGASVITGEDWEMALAACDLGLGMGHLPQLRLTHLISARRLELSYLLHLVETLCFSRQVFVQIRGLTSLIHYPPTRFEQLVRWLKSWRVEPMRRKFLHAEWSGLAAAHRFTQDKDFTRYSTGESHKANQIGVRNGK